MTLPYLFVPASDVRSLSRLLPVADAWALCPANSREGFGTRPLDLDMFADDRHLATILQAGGQFVHNGLRDQGYTAVVLIFQRHTEPGDRHKNVLLTAHGLTTQADLEAFERWAFCDTPRLTVFLRDPADLRLN